MNQVLMLNIKNREKNRFPTDKEEEIRAGFRALAEIIFEKWQQDRLQAKSTDLSLKESGSAGRISKNE